LTPPPEFLRRIFAITFFSWIFENPTLAAAVARIFSGLAQASQFWWLT
jgi:hypothetical protein